MSEPRNLSEQQVLFTIRNGEFGDDIIRSAASVAVIMTQDWCSEWRDMKNWVYSMNNGPDIKIYMFIYNTSTYFTEFLKLKETRWENDLIPYVRYYKSGKLSAESNYVSKDEFLDILKGS